MLFLIIMLWLVVVVLASVLIAQQISKERTEKTLCHLILDEVKVGKETGCFNVLIQNFYTYCDKINGENNLNEFVDFIKHLVKVYLMRSRLVSFYEFANRLYPPAPQEDEPDESEE